MKYKAARKVSQVTSSASTIGIVLFKVNFIPPFGGQLRRNEGVTFTGMRGSRSPEFTDCGFVMESVPGFCKKLMVLKDNDEVIKDLECKLKFNLQVLLTEFRRVGINYIEDSSAIYNQRTFVVIDFATMDPFEFELKAGIE